MNRDVPVYALRGYTGQEVLIGLSSRVFDGLVEVTPFEAFEAKHLRSRDLGVEQDRQAILQVLMSGAQAVRIVPSR